MPTSTETRPALSEHHRRLLDLLRAAEALEAAVEAAVALDPDEAPPDLLDCWSTFMTDAEGARWAVGPIRRLIRGELAPCHLPPRPARPAPGEA